jgi:hypothetical protein
MAMRSQVYEWSSIAGNSARGRASGSDATLAITADTDLSIFIGGKGNNITKPAETTATQFIVIEDVACSPQLEGAVQVRINTTDYFQNPDVTDQAGVPGLASPYPRGAPLPKAGATGNTTDVSTSVLPSFTLYPSIYVLPGQTFDVLYRSGVGVATTDAVACFVKYTLYDGPDALIANKLLEMGITVNPNNVDWYKRSLLEGGMA